MKKIIHKFHHYVYVPLPVVTVNGIRMIAYKRMHVMRYYAMIMMNHYGVETNNRLLR
jgi:hypothetical protein